MAGARARAPWLPKAGCCSSPPDAEQLHRNGIWPQEHFNSHHPPQQIPGPKRLQTETLSLSVVTTAPDVPSHPGVPRSPGRLQRVSGGAGTPAGPRAVLPRTRAGVRSSPRDSRQSQARRPGRLNQHPGGRRGPFPPPAPGKTS